MIPITKLSGRLGNQMFQLAYIYAKARAGDIPDIYVQDEKYFKRYEAEIKAMYSEDIGYVPQTAIHVRRGDYVNNPFYVDLFESGYYERAMAKFPNAEFLVFSDDIEWCKKQKIFKDCSFANGEDEVEDLNIMASCTNQIIANSSYSWWAAYLNPAPSKMVIAPKEWFTNGKEISLPAEWIRL